MKRNKRRVLALLLALSLVGTLAAPALASEDGDIHIRTAQDLMALSRNCSLDSWSVGKTVYLDADIDLSGSDFQPIPIFNGTFEGQGHTISGFSLSGSGSDRGFFRYVQASATIRDLTVLGSVAPSDQKDSIGGLVGVNSGKLLNCAFQGNVKGGTNTGGLVGHNKPTGQLINCTYDGTLLGEHYVGGIVGLNEGSVIRCQNDGSVNVTEVKTTVALHEVNLSTIRSTETVPASTDIGGIAGASSGILQSCTNNGDVGYEHVGYNVGGIAGRQSGWLDSCVNNGTVRGRKDVGGICGQMEPRLTLLFDSDSLDDLWDELDTLQALMDQAISDADGVSDAISAQITGISDSADAVKDAASGLSDAIIDWTDENIETINDVSARISWTMDRLEPIADDVDAALERIQDAAEIMEDGLDELDQMGALAEDAMDDLRRALARVRDSAQLASDAMDQIRGAFDRLEDALGDNGAIGNAIGGMESALDDLITAFGHMSNAFDDLWTALGDLYAQNGGFPSGGTGSDQPGEGTGQGGADPVQPGGTTDPDGGDGNTDQDTGDGNTDQDTGDGNTDQDTGDGNTDQDTDDGNTDQDTDDGNTDQDTDDGNTDQGTGGGNTDQGTGGGNTDQGTGGGNTDQGTGDGQDGSVLTRTRVAPRQARYVLSRLGTDTSLAGSALTQTGTDDGENEDLGDGGTTPDAPDTGSGTTDPDTGGGTTDPDAGGGGNVDWTAVLEALDQMSGAASQIQSAFRALKNALNGTGSTAGALLRETLGDIAAAADDLSDGFHTLDRAAGHMEDALEDLEDASSYGNRASARFKEAAETLGEACDQLRRAGDTFSDVMSELADKPEISFAPVGEAVNEKRDVLDDAMSGLSDAIQGLNDTMSASSDLLLADMRAINNQFGKVIDVLRRHTGDSEAEEEDEELLEDVSDQVTETDEDAGRITNATNAGTVEGDVNVAGIVGSMAIEYDYDPEDDLTTSGDRSLDFHYQAAALTEGCVNNGNITGKKDYVGGIVGRMDLGTVSQCESYAPVESTGGDYVGGIAGAAWSTIRDCWARCALAGKDYIGGVAGLGKTVTDCRSLVEIDDGSAYLGAVLGCLEEDGTASGNLFTHHTLSGIDGISYLGQAEPVDFETLSQNAPYAFTRFRLVFTADGQVVDTFDFSYGDALSRLPDIPEKEGYSASWPEMDYDFLTFSRTLDAEYTPYSTALTALGDPPQIVAEGTFSFGSSIAATCADDTWTDAHGTAHTGTVYTVTVTDPAQPITDFQVQCKLPDGAADGTVWVKTAAGWEERDAQLDGTYLVFRAEGNSVTFAVQERTTNPVLLILAISGGVAAAGALVYLWRKKKPKSKA